LYFHRDSDQSHERLGRVVHEAAAATFADMTRLTITEDLERVHRAGIEFNEVIEMTINPPASRERLVDALAAKLFTIRGRSRSKAGKRLSPPAR
jgi:hypothetical protein